MDRNETPHAALAHRSPTRLGDRLAAALRRATDTGDERALDQIGAATPTDRRDGLAALGAIYDLSLAPIDQLGGDERWQHHPAVATLRRTLETTLVEHLDALAATPDGDDRQGDESITSADAVAGMRRLAHADAVPDIYRWLATTATEDELIEFLSLEGGPDGGFDDLVALAQVGLGGRPKLEMARNYWDEMGRGTLDDVHTALHERLAAALRLRAVPRSEQPEDALLRAVLGSFLVLSRTHQPEAVGALGLVELQAGPRCRWVLRALDRLGVAPDARPFYAEHAEADPRHGRDWLDGVVGELAVDPRWAGGILRGARWRAAVSEQFFRAALGWFVASAPVAASASEASRRQPASRALRAG